MKLSEAGQRVFDTRYAMIDDNGNIIETLEPIDPSLLCECGAIMERAEGCMVCRNCGYSKC